MGGTRRSPRRPRPGRPKPPPLPRPTVRPAQRCAMRTEAKGSDRRVGNPKRSMAPPSTGFRSRPACPLAVPFSPPKPTPLGPAAGGGRRVLPDDDGRRSSDHYRMTHEPGRRDGSKVSGRSVRSGDRDRSSQRREGRSPMGSSDRHQWASHRGVVAKSVPISDQTAAEDLASTWSRMVRDAVTRARSFCMVRGLIARTRSRCAGMTGLPREMMTKR